MIQKAILQIDSSKGVKKSSRFQAKNSVTATAADRLKQKASDVVKTVRDVGAGPSSAFISGDTITVQYNPASIKYHASTSTKETTEPEAGSETRMITSVTAQCTVDMSFELIFHNTGSKDESTKEQMELVMNMLYDSPTKNVRFAWGALGVEGKLVSFSGEYDMFDSLGRPISGRMRLTIRTVTPPEVVTKNINEIEKKRDDKPAAQNEGDNRKNEERVQGA